MHKSLWVGVFVCLELCANGQTRVFTCEAGKGMMDETVNIYKSDFAVILPCSLLLWTSFCYLTFPCFSMAPAPT